MINKNFKRALRNSLFSSSGVVKVKKADETLVIGTLNNTIYNAWVGVGSGSTPPSVTDYKLENPINILVKKSNVRNIPTKSSVDDIPYDDDDTNYSFSITTTYYYGTSYTENLAVREVGLLAQNNQVNPSTILTIREVLETPLIMHPGETYAFTIKVG